MNRDSPIQLHYIDALGRTHRPSKAALEAVRAAMQPPGRASARSSRDALIVCARGDSLRTGPAEIQLESGISFAVDRALPRDLPIGYHTIRRRRDRTDARLIVAPRRCYLPDDYNTWGWAIQLYASRSRRSWGIGDLADLRRLNQWASRDGAGIALVNPLASAAPILPQEPSPYFPTSRRFRNPLYLRIEDVDGAREADDVGELAASARALNRDRLIDRDRVYRLKMRALDAIWGHVGRREDTAFERYLADIGAPLLEYATFCALAERFGRGWHSWPVGYRTPRAALVRRASADSSTADRIRFHAWLQYQIDRQLSAASRALPIMQDLPIGFDPDGADAWSFQDVLAEDVSVGAPPDEFNTKGQNWGLPPFVPSHLRRAGYEPFIQTIRACLRHAGGLRIDHVMGLFRLFWIPRGMESGDGVYVRNRADELLAIVALESHRARAVIVGEDLGTVEEKVRAELMDRSVLSYRLVWFEKTQPRTFPNHALAAISTHDLPTIAGLWTSSDLEAQKRLRLAPNEKGTREIQSRVRRLTKTTASADVHTVIGRLYAALAKAPARIVTATLDDAMAVEERPNMPASGDRWPNWSLALPRPIESLETDALPRRIAQALRRR
jgi:4-alpha-glucanotransferase